MLFKDIAALVIFCLVIICTILLVLIPVTVTLPRCLHSTAKQLTISYSAVPVAGVILMLCTGSLDAKILAQGIVGDENLKPYGIVILFLALAYISTSLDSTGCLAWLALHITKLSKGNGMALFLLYFGLSSLITVFTSNDICIMTLTPIIYYFAVATSVDPIPFLTAQFTAANIWSMLLFIGNPTNIIVAMAYQMSFADYSKWMALPTLGAGFSCLVILLLIYYRSIPRQLALPDLQPAAVLVDKPGAAFGSINIIACLAFLAAAPSLGWELWLVTLVSAGLHAVYNLVAYVVCKGRWCKQDVGEAAAAGNAATTTAAAAAAGVSNGGMQQQNVGSQLELVHEAANQQQQQLQLQQSSKDIACKSSAILQSKDMRKPEALEVCADSSSEVHNQDADIAVCIQQTAASDPMHQVGADHDSSSSDKAAEDDMHVVQSSAVGHDINATAAGSRGVSVQQLLQVRKPSFLHVWQILPWEVVPFVLGMFVLVEGLNATGWIDRIALWLAHGVASNIWAALFGIGAFSVLLANLANNQPMTILMTRVTLSPSFVAVAAGGVAGVMVSQVPRAAALSVVIASNVAANYTVMGALAGIMYVNILQRKGLTSVTYATFSKMMLPAGVMSTVVALVVLGAEFVTW